MPQDPQKHMSVNHYSEIYLDLFKSGLEITIRLQDNSFTAQFIQAGAKLDKPELVKLHIGR